jgi:hypothetical protein
VRALKDELAAEEQERGLKPPGSISVEPSGTPVGAPDVGELSPPSGDVAPSAGVLRAVCAWPSPQLNKIAVIVRSSRGMDVTCDGRL